MMHQIEVVFDPRKFYTDLQMKAFGLKRVRCVGVETAYKIEWRILFQ